MRIYCSSCGEVRPVIIDDCRDAKTDEPFQDIVCEECHLVIASGKDIKKPWVDLTEEEINNSYMFWVVDQQDVIGFGKSLETKIKRKNT